MGKSSDELRYYWLPAITFTYGGPGRSRERMMREKGERVAPKLRPDIPRLHGMFDFSENWEKKGARKVPYPITDVSSCYVEALFSRLATAGSVPTSGIRFLTRLIKSQFCESIDV